MLLFNICSCESFFDNFSHLFVAIDMISYSDYPANRTIPLCILTNSKLSASKPLPATNYLTQIIQGLRATDRGFVDFLNPFAISFWNSFVIAEKRLFWDKLVIVKILIIIFQNN